MTSRGSVAEMESEGRFLDAIDALMDANRDRHDPDLERELVRLRHEAFTYVDRVAPSHEVPIARERPSGDVPQTISAADLTSDVLRNGILTSGSLHVRSLVPAARVQSLVEGIDRALAAVEARAERQDKDIGDPWYDPFCTHPSYPKIKNRELGNRRKWVKVTGGVWAADSPRMLFELFDMLDEVGLRQVISEYLGERPALTVDKCTLRRVGIDTDTNWHQDGAFLGSGIRTVNMWLALSHCGDDAPGLDIVPTRLDGIVETGTEGAIFPWSVGPGVVDRVAADAPVVRPIFEPGDVLFFDDLFLHRTAIDASMTRARYAIESWFFAPSAYPEQYVPLMV